MVIRNQKQQNTDKLHHKKLRKQMITKSLCDKKKCMYLKPITKLKKSKEKLMLHRWFKKKKKLLFVISTDPSQMKKKKTTRKNMYKGYNQLGHGKGK